ncbi:unnamed protein product [Fusarium fujikuroi]|nr:unnamed protein product [Fusarium fujikuroi]
MYGNSEGPAVARASGVTSQTFHGILATFQRRNKSRSAANRAKDLTFSVACIIPRLGRRLT